MTLSKLSSVSSAVCFVWRRRSAKGIWSHRSCREQITRVTVGHMGEKNPISLIVERILRSWYFFCLVALLISWEMAGLVPDLVSVLLDGGGEGLDEWGLLLDPCWWDSVLLGGSDDSWGSSWDDSWGSGQWSGVGVVGKSWGSEASVMADDATMVATWQDVLGLGGGDDGGDNSEGFHGGFFEVVNWRSTIER